MIEPRLRFKADDGSDFPDWEEKRLEDVVEFLDEKRKPLEAGKRVAGKYPYYGASGIIDYVEDYIFDEELILLSEDGANILDRNYRVCFLAKGKYWVNNHAHVMKAKKGNLNYFICEELETFDYRKYNSGGAQPKLNQASCRSIVVKIPSLPEQQKIADFLSTIDTIIEKQRATVSAWEERKKGVMQKLFSQEVRFKADDGSDFPDWEEKKFLDCISKIVDFRGRTPLKLGMAWSEEKTEYLALSALNVKMGYIDENIDAHYGNKKLYDMWMDGNELYKGQVLFTTEAPMGNVAQVPDNKPYILSQRTIAFVPKYDLLHDDFLVVLLSSSNVQRRLDTLATGGTAKGISQKSLKNFNVKIPCDLDEQQKIADCLSALDTVIQKQKETLEKWQELKKGLLQQMFV